MFVKLSTLSVVVFVVVEVLAVLLWHPVNARDDASPMASSVVRNFLFILLPPDFFSLFMGNPSASVSCVIHCFPVSDSHSTQDSEKLLKNADKFGEIELHCKRAFICQKETGPDYSSNRRNRYG